MKCHHCGAELKQGTKFCPKCGGKIQAELVSQNNAAEIVRPGAKTEKQAPRQPAQEVPAPAPAQSTAVAVPPGLSLDKYYFNQKILSIREAYYVYNEHQQEILFVKRLILALKRHIMIYTDRNENNMVMKLLQDQVFQIVYKWFTLVDEHGNTLARFRRNNFISLLRRSWDIFAPDGTMIAQVAEDSWGKALFRRFGPFGDFFKTDFIITVGEQVIGTFVRKLTIADKYVLDMSGDPQKRLDRRVALALGILLDTAEAR
ncbi:MAG TPA: zinc ribbon domain-containing protein [bacterium]|nr:zinc ribbon domain-containing protein [bacterium]